AAANARANGLEAVEAVALEWTEARSIAALGAFDVAVAAEVLYDPRHVRPFAAALASLLAPGGRAFLADPERLGPGTLLDAAREAGLELALLERAPQPPDVDPVDGAPPRPISLYRIRKRA
ncbi:MAG TPA: hypothetical protein VHF22_09685, partial [Planctomycetota bacterium]|nr:hypothetical protein [Planctomycetota bacterium]